MLKKIRNCCLMSVTQTRMLIKNKLCLHTDRFLDGLRLGKLSGFGLVWFGCQAGPSASLLAEPRCHMQLAAPCGIVLARRM